MMAESIVAASPYAERIVPGSVLLLFLILVGVSLLRPTAGADVLERWEASLTPPRERALLLTILAATLELESAAHRGQSLTRAWPWTISPPTAEEPWASEKRSFRALSLSRIQMPASRMRSLRPAGCGAPSSPALAQVRDVSPGCVFSPAPPL